MSYRVRDGSSNSNSDARPNLMSYRVRDGLAC